MQFLEGIDGQQIDAVIAVGSSVRDVAHVTDLDLLMVYSGEKPVFETPPLDVDIRCYEREKVENLLSQGHDLLGWAVRYGCVIRDPIGFWADVRDRWQNRVPLPSAEESQARARAAEKHYKDLLAIGDEDAAEEVRLSMLTHLARRRLIEAGVYPTSRPELAMQLRSIGEFDLANRLAEAIDERSVAA